VRHCVESAVVSLGRQASKNAGNVFTGRGLRRQRYMLQSRSIREGSH
jgi:hypothetical protein